MQGVLARGAAAGVLLALAATLGQGSAQTTISGDNSPVLISFSFSLTPLNSNVGGKDSYEVEISTTQNALIAGNERIRIRIRIESACRRGTELSGAVALVLSCRL